MGNALLDTTRAELRSLEENIARLHDIGVEKHPHTGIMDSHINVTYPPTAALPFTNEELLSGELKGKNTLYIHIPFCTGVCNHCGYDRGKISPDSPKIDKYLDLLSEESLILRHSFGGERIKVESIQIGGGTATILTIPDLERVFSFLSRDFYWDRGIEITLEGSPETISVAKLDVARRFGVTRAGFGAESFKEWVLSRLNRRHGKEEIYRTIERIKRAGIKNFDIGLMHGLPGQTPEMILDDINAIASIDPPSITNYQFMIKPHSYFANHPQDITFDQAQQILMHLLFVNGMEQQGRFQKPIDWHIKTEDHVYRHEILKWEENANQIALGRGVYGYINGIQYRNHTKESYEAYVLNGRLPVKAAQKLDDEEIMRRNFIFWLKSGVNRKAFQNRYGIDPMDAYKPEIERIARAGGIEVTDTIRLTKVGSLFADSIQREFFSDGVKRKCKNVN